MSTTLVMDKAGRVVIPKPLRKELQLEPGDQLEMETSGEQITLRPVRESPQLMKEQGIWVIQEQGETLPASAYKDVLDKIRLERESSFLNPVG